MKTWIVVAQRDGARIYEWTARSAPLRLCEDIAHPEGRLKDGEVEHGGSATKHELPTEHLASAFAKQVAQVIERARLKHSFDRLVLVAGPRFMGLLRDELSHSARELLAHEIVKNFGHLGADELKRHVEAEFVPRAPL